MEQAPHETVCHDWKGPPSWIIRHIGSASSTNISPLHHIRRNKASQHYFSVYLNSGLYTSQTLMLREKTGKLALNFGIFLLV